MMTLERFQELWNDSSDKLLVHTSGSTGQPKPLWVEKARMVASATMTLRFLRLHEGDTALLCMPLDYIAGMMMVVRATVGRLSLIDIAPTGHPLSDTAVGNRPIDFAAMVPIQVYNSLKVEKEAKRLRSIRRLIIGGGAVDEEMAAQLIDFPNEVWSTYGMTETLSHVAMRRLNGSDASDWYVPLPGVRVSQSQEGCLIIDAPQVCSETLVTHDIVQMHPDGQRFKVVGRIDNVICCGGVKIQAEEVERLLKPWINVPYLVGKAKDAKFGEIPVLVVEGRDYKNLEDIFVDVLPKYWIPKKTVYVERLPLTETGKPMRIIEA